ncbi:hypothetical protein ACFLRU_07040 [Bacteroidota bacterium]
MKNSYKKSVKLLCITCGESDFESEEDKTEIICKICNRKHLGGYDELLELNQENIDSEIEKTTEEVLKDFEKDFNKLFKNL